MAFFVAYLAPPPPPRWTRHRGRLAVLLPRGKSRRLRLHVVEDLRLKSGGWLCRLASPESDRRGETMAYSELVRRSDGGCWTCSCDKPDCPHLAAAKRLYRQRFYPRRHAG